MSKKAKKIVMILIIFMSVFLSYAVKPSDKVDEIYLKFGENIYKLIYYIVNVYYDKDKVDFDKVLDSTLKGLVDGLDDPFAWYLDTQQAEESKIEEKGEYGGLGMVVTYDSKRGAIKIISPMDGTPAERAGLKAGDLIITIDGSSVSELGYITSVKRLRGIPGTSVTIEVLREGWTEPKKFTLIREKIKTVTVKYDFIKVKDKNIAYLKLTNFGEKSAGEMKKALEYISQQNVDGLILDLRNNPGGRLDVCLEIASYFIKDKPIVKIRYYDGTEDVKMPHVGRYFEFLSGLPMVVLVNGGTASASEILTGALKDNHLATIVGEKTYGKAAVQSVIPLKNGGEVWLPTGHYFTPSGKDINLKGIQPDVVVKEKLEKEEAEKVEQIESKYMTTFKAVINLEKDKQLREAIEIILEKLKK